MVQNIKSDGVIVAAGLSSRAGGFKPAMEIGGKPVLARVIEAMNQVCSRIFVVGGYRIADIALITAAYSDVELIENKDFELGMFSSVQTGVRQVKADSFFIMPGDCPLVSGEVYAKMHAFFYSSFFDGDLLVPRYNGKSGHPILLAANLRSSILEESVNSNLKFVLQKAMRMDIDVAEEAVLLDLDTAEDYQKLAQLYQNLAE